MTDKEVMQMALDALVEAQEYVESEGWPYDFSESIEALRTALAQPDPKPVAWGIRNSRPTEKQLLTMAMLYEPPYSPLVVPLYTAPTQREWVGLTDDESNELAHGYSDDAITLMYETEAKLKEKNT